MESGREGERWRSRRRNGGSLILRPGVLDISPQHQVPVPRSPCLATPGLHSPADRTDMERGSSGAGMGGLRTGTWKVRVRTGCEDRWEW